MKKLLSLLTVMGASSVAMTGCFGSSSTNSDDGAGNITEGAPEVGTTPEEDPMYQEGGQEINEEMLPGLGHNEEEDDRLKDLVEGDELVWNDVDYKVGNDLKLTVTGADVIDGKLFIPSTLGAYKVTEVANGAFEDKGITSLTIGNNVETIGWNAFINNPGITELTIPASVKSIGSNAFSNTFTNSGNLETLIIEDGVESIEWQAFQNNNIAELTIPNSVKNIGMSAFANNNIANITINDGVESIAPGAFYNNRLTEVIIPATVKVIGTDSFGTNNITNVVFMGGTCMQATDVWGDIDAGKYPFGLTYNDVKDIEFTDANGDQIYYTNPEA